FDKTDHHVDGAAGDTQVRDQALFFTLPQHLDRATWLHGLFKGDMFGVVEMDELQLLQAQQAQAALDTAPHLCTGEDAGLQIAVGLCCQHEARRKPARLAEYDADATLALTIAVGSGGIQEVEGTRKESTNRGQGALLRYFVAEGLRHTPQRSCANTDRRHLQASRAKRAQCQWLWSFCLRRH